MLVKEANLRILAHPTLPTPLDETSHIQVEEFGEFRSHFV